MHGTSGIQIINDGTFGTLHSADLVLRTVSTERARLDTSGRLLVGTSTARSPQGLTPIFQIEGTGVNESSMSLTRNSADNGSATLIFNKSRGATVGSDVAVQNNDILGFIYFAGNDGTDSDNSAATISAHVDGTPGSNDMPGRLVFSTTADGAASPTTRLTIDSAGTSTFTGNITTTGTITSSGNLAITREQPIISFDDTTDNPDYYIGNIDGAFRIRDTTNSVTRFQVNTDGHIDIAGNLDVGAGIDVTGAITGTGDMTIDTNTLHVDSSNNRVGIGTTSPTSAGSYTKFLQISDTNSASVAISRSASGSAHTLELGAFSGASLIESTGATSLRFKTNSSERMRIDSSGRVLLGTTTEGHAAADELTISNTASAADMGMTLRSATNGQGAIYFSDGTSGDAEYRGIINYNHSSDFFSFFTAASERMRIDSSGKVGIGETTLDALLVIKGNSDASTTPSIRLKDGSDTREAWITNTAGDLLLATGGDDNTPHCKLTLMDGNIIHFSTANTERMRIDSVGDIFIGTSTDIAPTNGTNLCVSDSSVARLILEKQSTIKFGINVSSGFTIYDETNDAARLTIDSSGNVGINQTPTRELSLHSPNNNNALIHFTNDDTGETAADGILVGLDGNENMLIANQETGKTIRVLNGGSERMIINSSGNVGIGNTDASNGKLDVNDSSGAVLSLTRTNGATSGDLGRIRFGNRDVDSNLANIVAFQDGATNNGALSFETQPAGGATAERMRISSGGDLVINSSTARVYNGHTPRLSVQGTNFSQSTVAITNNANDNSGAYLFFVKQKSGSVGGSTAVSDGTMVGQMRYLAGDGTDTESEVANITVSIDGTPGSNDTPGRITFATTNDGGSTSTERMRINQSGQVLVGTTSANSVSARLVSAVGSVPSYYANPAGLSVTSGNNANAHCVEFFQGRFDKRVLTLSSNYNQSVTFQVFEQADVNVGIITGNGSTTNFNTNPSDRSLKKNFESWDENVLSLFKNINPQKFNYLQENDGDDKSKGFIAQEMVDSFPEAYPLVEHENDKYYFNPSGMVVYLMKAIQELEAKVAALEAA